MRGERCVPNIGSGERRKRLAFGVAAGAAAVILFAGLLALGAGRGWRLFLFVPLWGAAIGFFQYRAKT